jgi:hypothetical protein
MELEGQVVVLQALGVLQRQVQERSLHQAKLLVGAPVDAASMSAAKARCTSASTAGSPANHRRCAGCPESMTVESSAPSNQ